MSGMFRVTASMKLAALFITVSHRFVLIFSQTLQFLQQNAKERSESSASTTSTTTTSYTLPQTSSKMSMQELDELRKKLGNVTASSNAPLVSVSCSDAVDPKVQLQDLFLTGDWMILIIHSLMMNHGN